MLIGIMEPEIQHKLVLEKVVFQYYCRETDVDYVLFSDMEELLYYNRNNEAFDIVIIDITSEHKNWIHNVKELYAKNKQMMMIYLADDYTHVQDAIAMQAFQYMLKPFQVKDIEKEMERAIKRYRRTHRKYMILTRTERIVVEQKELMYIERLNNHLYAHTTKKTYDYIGSIKEAEERLKAYNFIKIHRAFLVNLAFVQAVNGDRLYLNNGKELFISRSCRKDVRECMELYQQVWAV